MAKFVIIHERTEYIMTTVEAETDAEAFEKYGEYADEHMDEIDRRQDCAYPLYGTYCRCFENEGELNALARHYNVHEVMTLEEAMNRG